MSRKSLKDQLLNLGFKASVAVAEKPAKRNFIKADSHWWNWELGVCEKHFLPSVPCPACLASDDPGLFEAASSMERTMWDDLDYYNNNP